VHGAHIFENPTISPVLWITAAVFFLLCPFFASSSRRKRCAARIRQRRWNVGQQQNRDWYREVAARMEERYVGFSACPAVPSSSSWVRGTCIDNWVRIQNVSDVSAKFTTDEGLTMYLLSSSLTASTDRVIGFKMAYLRN